MINIILFLYLVYIKSRPNEVGSTALLSSPTMHSSREKKLIIIKSTVNGENQEFEDGLDFDDYEEEEEEIYVKNALHNLKCLVYEAICFTVGLVGLFNRTIY